MTDAHRQKLLRIVISTMTLMFFALSWLIAGTIVAPHCSIDEQGYASLCLFKLADAAGFLSAGASWALLWHLLDFVQLKLPPGRVAGFLASYALPYAIWLAAGILVTISIAGPFPLLENDTMFDFRWIDDPLLDATETIFLPLTILICMAKAVISIRSRFQIAA